MPEPVLTLLKYVFLAVLYLFFLRVLRAVWVELREPKPAPISPGPGPVPSDAVGGAAAIADSVPAETQGSPGPDKLVVVGTSSQKGTEFSLSDETTVGRARGCGVLLEDDTFVSQLHARVFRREGDLFVEDLGSTNGTYLNKKKVTSPVPIRKGDKVTFGRTTLELRKAKWPSPNA